MNEKMVVSDEECKVAIRKPLHLLMNRKLFILYNVLIYLPVLLSLFVMAASVGFGIVLLIAAFVFADYVLPRKLLKRAASYDGNDIILNPDSKIAKFTEHVPAAEVTAVRIRRVKKPVFDTRFRSRYLNGYTGKYDVMAFDTADRKNALDIVFYAKGNIDEFMPALKKALADHGKNESVISRNEMPVTIKQFEKE
ncbi:MAG: hypothetical protein M0P01_13450 [Treponema sp.]|nr:hypothetical protein [Treponema sp.]